MRLLEQSSFPLQERTNRNSSVRSSEVRRVFDLHGAIPVILDGLDLNLSATHGEAARSGSYAHASLTK